MVIEERTDKGPALPTSMNVLRCWRCGNVLARIFLLPGCAVEVKCGKCHAFNTAAVEEKRTA